jgi:ribosomal protein S18 acetylase RimI-like enzyme
MTEPKGDVGSPDRPGPRSIPTRGLPDGITIRAARPGDARSFLAFWAAVVAEGRNVRSETVRHPPRVYRRRFGRSWTPDEAHVVAVDEEGNVVGHLFVQREDHPVTRHVASLGIAVDAAHRGSGIGRALMSEAFRWARTFGVEKIVLSVYPHNAAAISLYRSFGFVEEGRLARHSRKSYGYEDEILMAAWLGEDST